MRALQPEWIKDINVTNEPFNLFGRVVPQFQNGSWSYEEILFDESRETCFPEDRLNWNDYIGQENKALFLAYDGQACVGQIRLIRDWTRFGYIENIATIQAYRRSGVGKMLLDQAEAWAKDKQLIGLSLEAQDDNLAACRFYAKHGFVLGGVDTLKQSGNANIDATLYWYKIFG
ncbi:GNAT family N-acetyltransferase [Paenibacillus albus]|uniref:GNAT family N-acetyltransferase n=2 Tax=Paenibacillus albus TaxID=2495582 RepID=A0A3S9AE20_9BACL|nr:GNAT family N-acetyltransferase [Paenibacillus albus]